MQSISECIEGQDKLLNEICSQTIGKKEFRKETTKLKRELKLFMDECKTHGKQSNSIEINQNNKLDEIESRIFSSIQQLQFLFINKRKKISGADNPSQNLIGFGKPAFVDKYLIRFFSLNFGKIDGKDFKSWFPVLSETGMGSRIQLQNLLNLIIKITGSRIREKKKREQISVSRMNDMDKLIERTNQILLNDNKDEIMNKDTISSSDILKILNVFVSKSAQLTPSQKEALENHKDDIRRENMISKRLLDDYNIHSQLN